MKHVIIFRDRAYLELEDAVLYYESKRRGLGDAFLKQVEATLHIISRSPELFSLRYKNTAKSL